MSIALTAMAVLFALGQPSTPALQVPESVRACLAERKGVCIEQGVDGNPIDTRARLERHMTSGDRIIIVMLPPVTPEPSREELTSFASRIDDLTEHKYIIGLSVGDEVIGQSSILPSGVATDQMMRARNVSMNTAETHLTFITNIHHWLSQHPNVSLPPEPAAEDSTNEGSLQIPWGGIIGGALGGLAALFFLRRNKVARAKVESEQFPSTPNSVRELLGIVVELRGRVNDPALQAIIKQACGDTHAYFQRNTHPKYVESDAEQFCGHLENVRRVLDRYIDIQNYPRYYPGNTAALLQQGQAAVDGFAGFVLESIHRGSEARLMEYSVQTDILSAQRGV